MAAFSVITFMAFEAAFFFIAFMAFEAAFFFISFQLFMAALFFITFMAFEVDAMNGLVRRLACVAAPQQLGH